jgi:hypothetical protein
MVTRWWSVGLVVLIAGCSGGSSKARDAGPPDAGADARQWGAYPSPPLDQLVTEALAKGAAPAVPAPYPPPARVTVAQPPPVDVSWLPRDEQGRPILLDDGVLRYVVDLNKRDPVSAMGRCARMLSGCPQRTDVAGARTIDACWASVPACATNQPWTETAACCPARCVDLYRKLRELGFDDRAANRRAVESLCFNGLREQLEAR